MDDIFDAAVDRAVSEAQAPASATDPPKGETPAAPTAAASLPVAPAAGSAVDLAASSPVQASDAQPKSAPDEDADVLKDDQGWLDKEKRSTILRNAKAKARNETLTRLGLHADVDVANVREHILSLARDRVGYTRRLVESLRAEHLWPDDPPAARDALRPASASPPDRRSSAFELPAPDVEVDTDGGRVGLYRTDTIGTLISQVFQLVRDQTEERLRPIEDREKQIAEADRNERVNRSATNIVETARQDWPGFKALEKQIGQTLFVHHQRGEHNVTLADVYARFLPSWQSTELTRVTAEAEARGRQSTLQQLNGQPADPAIARPGGARARVPGGKRTSDLWDQALNHGLDKAGISR